MLDLCRFWSALLSDALAGHDRAQLSQLRTPALMTLRSRNLKPAVRAILYHATASTDLAPDAIGVTVMALRAFASAADFRGAIDTVVQNQPSATAAAVCGALAGAHYGMNALPREWSALIPEQTKVVALAARVQLSPWHGARPRRNDLVHASANLLGGAKR